MGALLLQSAPHGLQGEALVLQLGHAEAAPHQSQCVAAGVTQCNTCLVFFKAGDQSPQPFLHVKTYQPHQMAMLVPSRV